MTIANTCLGECPECSKDSKIHQYSSYNSYGEKFILARLFRCGHCNHFEWQKNIKIKFDNVEGNEHWWSSIAPWSGIDILEENKINNKELTEEHRLHIVEVLETNYKEVMESERLHNRARGCLDGLSHADIDGGTSSMALLAFNSLVENKNFRKDKVDHNDIGRRYLDWYNDNAVDTGIVNAMVFDLVNGGATFEDASKQVDVKLHGMTASSRPACRSLPISIYLAGMINTKPDEWKISDIDKTFTDLIDKETKLTHRNLHASQISRAVNMICMYLILGYSIDESIEAGGVYVSQKTSASLGLTSKSIKITKKDLKNTGYADEALIASIWFIRNTSSFDEAVNESMKLKGKSNYCSVLVGAIGGAYYGYNNIKDGLRKYSKFFHAPVLLLSLTSPRMP